MPQIVEHLFFSNILESNGRTMLKLWWGELVMYFNLKTTNS